MISLLDRIKDQTLSFTIDLIDTKERNSIQDLDFGPFDISYYYMPLYDIPPPPVFFSTLLKLHINVTYFEDCIYLLNGRFKQLYKLYVTTFLFQSV